MKRRKILQLVAGLTLAACTVAPERPPHAPVNIPITSARLAGHVYLPVTVNGVAGMALLDNGWWRSGVDVAFAKAQGLIKDDRSRNATTVTLNLGGLEWQTAPIVENFSQLNVGGGLSDVVVVVGAEFFAEHIVEIDYTSQRVIIHDQRGFVAPAGFTQIALTSPSKAGETRFPARIEGEALDVILDLGGGHDGVLFKPGPLARRLLANRPSVPVEMGAFRDGVTKPFQDARGFSIRDLTFAGFSLTDVPAATGDSQIAPRADANIGSAILQRFDLIFDTAGRRLWLRPNSRFAQPFGYNLIGSISWTIGPKPTSLRVTKIEAGSPAEKSGLKLGDVVVRFWGAPATPANMEALRIKGPPKPGDAIDIELDDGRTLRAIAARYY